MSRAEPNEMVFVLLGRDPIAPIVIRIWCMLRVLISKNQKNDKQIVEALECADVMEKERKET